MIVMINWVDSALNANIHTAVSARDKFMDEMKS